ncbi:MAG: HD domain-containing phosphohydrolase [Pirellulaceae bacterium]
MNSAKNECGQHVIQIQAQLSSLFACQFSVWGRVESTWKPIADSVDAIPHWPETYRTTLSLWFDELQLGPEETPLCKLVNDQIMLATRVLTDGGEGVLIVGRIPDMPQQVAERAARMAICLVQHEAESAEQKLLVEQYADRLTNSYEELTFLRRLSRHVEYCTADRSLVQAASSILPQICKLAALEGVCLVEVSDASERKADRVLEAAGNLVDFHFAVGFIDELGPANRRIFVKNYQSDLAMGCPSPRADIRSLVTVPIEKDGKLFGWLVGANKCRTETESWATWAQEIGSIEASLLEAAALMLGSHAANNQLFREKESLVVEIIHTLVGVIEAKDVYTVGHSDRVALIARRLGQELGLAPETCHDIFLSGLLHDIGKIGVADDVLLKPGKLTEEEFAQVKTHPERGARLIRVLKPLENLVPGVLHHHEAVDGSGYPYGLVGEQIPLMARVLAVADAFDAMTSDRPYRAGMPLSKAEEILRNGAGKHWDATVVEAYFAARSEIIEIGLQWQDHLQRLLDWRSDCADCGEPVAATAISYQPLMAPECCSSMTCGTSLEVKPLHTLRRRRAGVTLIDLVICIMIMGILTAVGAPKFASTVASLRCEAVAKRIASDLNFARRKAIQTSQVVTITFRTEPAGYDMNGVTNPADPTIDYSVNLADIDGSVSMQSASFDGSLSFSFNNYGRPLVGLTALNSGNITVTSGTHSSSVTIEAATGEAIIP